MVKLINQDYLTNKKRYLDVEKWLKQIVGAQVEIEHVGSTAIPDIKGKNIVDILLGAKDKQHFEELAQLLSANGFFGSVRSKTDIYQFFASRQEETGDGDVHIHLVVVGTDRHDEFVILRDFLLANKNEAQQYSRHKEEILNLGEIDRKTYREIKSKYVSALIQRAKDWRNKQTLNN